MPWSQMWSKGNAKFEDDGEAPLDGGVHDGLSDDQQEE